MHPHCLQDLQGEDSNQITFLFSDETSGEECKWAVAMETENARQSLVHTVKELWEAEFGVDLQINISRT